MLVNLERIIAVIQVRSHNEWLDLSDKGIVLIVTRDILIASKKKPITGIMTTRKLFN